MSTRHFTPEEMAAGYDELRAKAMLWAACNIPDCPVTGVDLEDSDVVKYLVNNDEGIDFDIKDYL